MSVTAKISQFLGRNRGGETSVKAVESENQMPSPSGPATVIELFQSQGCNSCPPTNDNLVSLLQNGGGSGQNILLLNYHVTYWDYLGWSDPFGGRAFDLRQREYVERLKLRSAFTPQVIINGKASGVGNTTSGLQKLLMAGKTEHSPIRVNAFTQQDGNTSVSITASTTPSREALLRVMLVTYDPTEVKVTVPRGENAGSTLRDFNIVKSLSFLGDCRIGENKAFTIKTESSSRHWRRAVLVQDGVGGAIMASYVL